MARRSAPVPVNCTVCGKQINRKADLGRHMKVHAPNKDELKFSCPHENCPFKTLQKSNLETHLNRHRGERPHACPSCTFCTGDPASLLRHRVRKHGYIPKSDSSGESDSDASINVDDMEADESVDSESSFAGALVPELRNSSPAFDTALIADYTDANSLQLPFDVMMPQSHLVTGQVEMFNHSQPSLLPEDPVTMFSLFTGNSSDPDMSFGDFEAYLQAYNNSLIEGAPLAPMSTASPAQSMTYPTVNNGSVTSHPLYIEGHGNSGTFSPKFDNGYGNNEHTFYANGNGNGLISCANTHAGALGPQYEYRNDHFDDAPASYADWNDHTFFATHERSQEYTSAFSLPYEYGSGHVNGAPASYAGADGFQCGNDLVDDVFASYTNGNAYTSYATHGCPEEYPGAFGTQYGNGYINDAPAPHANENDHTSYATRRCPEEHTGALGSQYGNGHVDDVFTSYGNDYTHATPKTLQNLMQQLNSITVPDIDLYLQEGNQNTMYTIPDGTAGCVF